MASIQQGINQLIGSAAIGIGLYTRSPAGQANAATREAQRAENAAAGYKTTLANPDAFTGTPQEQALKRQGMQKLYQSSRDSALKSRLQALNLNPTQERVDSYLDSYAKQQAEIQEENAQNRTTKAAQAARQAMDRMRSLGMDQIQQNKNRRKFMDYLRKQDTSLGKVGDLPPGIQKSIAKSYSASERKKLMDAADAAKKKEGKDGRKV